jgi:integrase/recombinase XerC
MNVLSDFERNLEHNGVSQVRRRDHLRVLRQVANFLAPATLTTANAENLTAYLAERNEAGYAPNTLRKERQMALSFFTWAHETGQVSAETLIAMQSVVSPQGATSRSHPKRYLPKELRFFREVINTRWPLMDDERARKFARRWQKGDTPYSRIRKHAIRLQLDAVISLALHGGLRRREIFALHVDDLHYDNAYIVVWSGERWNSSYREVPYTEEARSAVRAWLDFRACMGVKHGAPWLNLWAAKTAREPIKADAFAKLLSAYVAPSLSYRRLRHTCGIAWLKAGMKLWEVQRLLGHASLRDTLPYGEAVETSLQGRIERHQGSFSRALAAA